MMKKIYISLLMALFIHIGGHAQESEFSNAASLAYGDANYVEAIDQYKQALSIASAPTAELYYNLGCAYYKNGDLADAILCFERAYRIDPADSDIHFNLELASNQIVDKMDPVRKLFISKWLDSASHWFTLMGWMLTSIFTFGFFTIGLFLFLRNKRARVQKIGLVASVVSLILFILSITLMHRLNNFINDDTEGILMSEVVTVKSSPDSSAQDIVVVHSGLKVVQQQELGGFSEVKLPDGTIGWIPSKSFEIINNFSER
ncbi:tetratricopeptide repeat protein [Porphyromonadaceae bacterium W3.11]|nr:tetratricopeptide repeat protein [Porphyromonadaceae bacterium W3.11]